MELRQKIAKIQATHSIQSGEVYHAEYWANHRLFMADKILALPEIAAGLKLLERAKENIPNGKHCCFISTKCAAADIWCEEHSCSGERCELLDVEVTWDEKEKRHVKCLGCPKPEVEKL